MMAAHDGIVFLQLFVFLGNAMVNLEIYLCCQRGLPCSLLRAFVHRLWTGAGPSERPSGKKQNLLGRNTNW